MKIQRGHTGDLTEFSRYVTMSNGYSGGERTPMDEAQPACDRTEFWS